MSYTEYTNLVFFLLLGLSNEGSIARRDAVPVLKASTLI
jgi:hypothetical protein